jgi:hypothetical protein
MKRLLLSAILGVCAALPARSQEPVPVPPKPVTEGPPPAVLLGLPPLTSGVIQGPCGCGEKTIWVPRLTLVPEETAIAVPKMALREIEVARDKVTKTELNFRDERHKVTEVVLKPRVCEQQVVVMTLKPETTTDPVTGRSCTVQKQVPVTQTVKVTVYDTECVEREVVVRVPCLKQVEQDVAIKKLVVDHTSEAAILRRYHSVLIPNEIRVLMPCCPFCPPDEVEPEKRKER